jgi:Bacterial proteasome activator
MESAGPGGQPDVGMVTPPRLAVIIGRPADASRVCRVDAPDRVLRVWAMLASADGELHQASLRPEAVPRLQRQLEALTAELDRSLSPALAGELHHLVGWEAGAELTADELRVEYATLLSWTIGLVIGILTELEQASAKALRAAARPQPAASRLWPSEARGTSEYPRDNERP